MSMAGNVWEHTTPDGRTYNGAEVYETAIRQNWIAQNGQGILLLFQLIDHGVVEVIETPKGQELALVGVATFQEAVSAMRSVNQVTGVGWKNDL